MMIIYEHAVTFEEEVDLFWNRKFSGATMLFLCNRYLVLAVALLELIGFIPMSDESCTAFVRASNVPNCLKYLPWAAFSALRAFALCRLAMSIARPRLFAFSGCLALALFIFSLYAMPMGVNFVHYRFDVTGVILPITGCNESDNAPASLGKILTIVSRTSVITADLILMIITWRTTVREDSIKGVMRYGQWSFKQVLLRNGLIYFAVLFILNTLHLTFSMLSITDELQNSSFVSDFTDPITAVLVSRFLMDLQKANKMALGEDVPLPTHTDTLVFDKIVGSLGSSIGEWEADKHVSAWDDVAANDLTE